MPGEVFYEDSVERSLNAKLGERFSVLDISPIAGKGVDNESPVFAEAYDDKIKKGGGSIYVPGAVGPGYKLTTPLELAGTEPIEFIGEGRASRIYRGADMPAGKGMFDLNGARKITFRHLSFDGEVLTSAQLLYSEFGSDPAHPLLTTNSTFWLKGCEDITFEDCDFEHTGGYAAYIDARSTDCRRIRFVRCRFRNNRPHTFGTAAADMMDPLRRVRGVKIDWERDFPSLLAGSASVYGSWTGGVFYHNQATGGSSRVQDLSVNNCRFERNTGNCVWGHGYGFTAFHQRIHVDYNTFLDCGLDAILFGNVVGGSAIGNSMRRIGYICSDDAGPSIPRWLPNLNATGIDTSGVVKLVTYANNNLVSVNGGAINGDGFAYGTITGNTIRVPRSSDPEYAEDSIGTTFGPGGAGANWSQGVVLGNTADKEGGEGVSISGNFCDNLGGTSIGLFAARKCQASGNTIIAPSTANQQPITIGGILTGANQVATDNVITENLINYAPATPAPAIFEDPTYRVFTPADINRVVKNVCIGGANVFEFRRDPNSDTKCAIHFTTEAVATYSSRHGIAREGIGEGSSLRFYAQDSDPWGNIHMSLNMYRAQGARGPLLNVSETGPGPPEVVAEGGCITTGNVTQLPFGNAMATSKLSASGFLALGDSTYWEVEADMLPSTHPNGWALMRWDGLLAKWQQSVEGGGAAGPRIWTDFAAGGSGTATRPADPFESVQFNDGGVFGGSANFLYSKDIKRVTVICDPATPGVNVAGGYISSAQGFLAMPATATTYNAIQASNGGVFALSATIKNYITWGSNAAPVPTINDSFLDNGVINYDDPNKIFNFRTGQYNPATENTDLVDVSCFALGFAASSAAANAIQAPAGGVTGQWLIAQDSLIFIERTEPPVSGPNQVRIYASLPNGQMYISANQAPYGPFGHTNPGAPEGSVQYNRGGQFAGNANLFWDEGINLLYVTSAAGQAAINVDGGWMQSAGGFVTTSASLAVQALSGVIIGRYLATNESLIFKGLASPPGLSDASGGPQVRLYASSGGVMYISSNGAAWGPLMGTVTPPAGASGQVQYNYNGAFGASAYLTYNWDANVMTLYGYFQTNAVNNPVQWVMNKAYGGGQTVYYVGIDESARYFVQAASYGPVLLYLTPSGDPNATMLSTPGTVQSLYVNAVGSSPLSIQAASGGVTARWICANESLIFLGIGQPALSTGGQVRMYASTSGVLYVSANGAAYGPIGGQPPAGGNQQVQFNNNGQFGASANFAWDNANNVLGINGPNGYMATTTSNDCQWYMHRPNVYIYWVGINASAQWIVRGMDGFTQLAVSPNGASGMIVSTPGTFQSLYVNALGGVINSIQAASGGVTAKWLVATEYLVLKQANQPAVAAYGEVKIYANPNGVTYISTSNQAYGPLGGISSTTQPQWTATNTGGSYTFNNANNYFIVDGNGNISGNGVVSGAGGVTSSSQQSNAIQTAGGFNAGYSGSANGSFSIYGNVVINYQRQFVGSGGVSTGGNIITTANISAASYQVSGGYYGVDVTGGIQVGAGAPTKTLYFKGGICYYAG